MKNGALLLALVGLMLLSAILLFQKPVSVSDYRQLNSLEENTLVLVHGDIVSTYSYLKKYQIQLDNNISCIVSSVPLNKTGLNVLGIVQKYQGKSNILSLEISNGP